MEDERDMEKQVVKEIFLATPPQTKKKISWFQDEAGHPAWKDGSCCCNCESLIEIRKHPWNEGEGKGNVSEVMGYACTVALTAYNEPHATFFDGNHGFCELHSPTPERKKILEIQRNAKKFNLL